MLQTQPKHKFFCGRFKTWTSGKCH